MSILVEPYAPGLDVTVPVLGGAAPIALGVVAPGSNRRGSVMTEDLKRDDPLGYAMYDPGPDSDGFLADVGALRRATGPVDYLRMDCRFDPATGKRVFLGQTRALMIADTALVSASPIVLIDEIENAGIDRRRRSTC